MFCYVMSCLVLFFESLLRTESPSAPSSGGDEWRTAFEAAANGHADPFRSGSNGHSRRFSDPPQNGDDRSSSQSSRRTPTRLPPAPPPQSTSQYRY